MITEMRVDSSAGLKKIWIAIVATRPLGTGDNNLTSEKGQLDTLKI